MLQSVAHHEKMDCAIFESLITLTLNTQRPEALTLLSKTYAQQLQCYSSVHVFKQTVQDSYFSLTTP